MLDIFPLYPQRHGSRPGAPSWRSGRRDLERQAAAFAARRFRHGIMPARPALADAMRAIVEGSGTTVMKPVVGLNVADCPAARPVAFTAEKLPERPPVLAKICSTSVPSASHRSRDWAS